MLYKHKKLFEEHKKTAPDIEPVHEIRYLMRINEEIVKAAFCENSVCDKNGVFRFASEISYEILNYGIEFIALESYLSAARDLNSV